MFILPTLCGKEGGGPGVVVGHVLFWLSCFNACGIANIVQIDLKDERLRIHGGIQIPFNYVVANAALFLYVCI